MLLSPNKESCDGTCLKCIFYSGICDVAVTFVSLYTVVP